MFNSFLKYFSFITLILIFISIFIIKYPYNSEQEYVPISSSQFNWPLPGNHNITSPFGKRTSPTSGASSSHSGIDIAATEGTPIYSCFPGKVTFTGFKGAGGYTLTIENGTISASYCHISPNYLYSTGQYITSNTIVAHVGPKNVYNVIGNPYKDSNRKSNKRSYNRMSSPFNNKKRRQSRQSIKLFLIIIWRII